MNDRTISLEPEPAVSPLMQALRDRRDAIRARAIAEGRQSTDAETEKLDELREAMQDLEREERAEHEALLADVEMPDAPAAKTLVHDDEAVSVTQQGNNIKVTIKHDVSTDEDSDDEENEDNDAEPRGPLAADLQQALDASLDRADSDDHVEPFEPRRPPLRGQQAQYAAELDMAEQELADHLSQAEQRMARDGAFTRFSSATFVGEKAAIIALVGEAANNLKWTGVHERVGIGGIGVQTLAASDGDLAEAREALGPRATVEQWKDARRRAAELCAQWQRGIAAVADALQARGVFPDDRRAARHEAAHPVIGQALGIPCESVNGVITGEEIRQILVATYRSQPAEYLEALKPPKRMPW